MTAPSMRNAIPVSQVLNPPLVPSGRAIDMVEAFAAEAVKHKPHCPARWAWLALCLEQLRKVGVTPPPNCGELWGELVRVLAGERNALGSGGPSWPWTKRKRELLTALTGGAA